MPLCDPAPIGDFLASGGQTRTTRWSGPAPRSAPQRCSLIISTLSSGAGDSQLCFCRLGPGVIVACRLPLIAWTDRCARGSLQSLEPVQSAILAPGLSLAMCIPLDEECDQHHQGDEIPGRPDDSAGQILIIQRARWPRSVERQIPALSDQLS